MNVSSEFLILFVKKKKKKHYFHGSVLPDEFLETNTERGRFCSKSYTWMEYKWLVLGRYSVGHLPDLFVLQIVYGAITIFVNGILIPRCQVLPLPFRYLFVFNVLWNIFWKILNLSGMNSFPEERDSRPVCLIISESEPQMELLSRWFYIDPGYTASSPSLWQLSSWSTKTNWEKKEVYRSI